MLRALRFSLSIPFLLLSAQLSPAAAILSNLPGANSSSFGAILGAATRSFAVGFTTDGSSYDLDSVTMHLRVNAAGGTFSLGLYGDSSGPVGPELVAFTVPTLDTTGAAEYTFTPDAPFVLGANTTYWLVAYSLVTGSANQIQWAQAGPAVTPTGVATYVGARFDTPAVVPPTGSIAGSPNFAINATATGVPEPSTVTLLGAGAAFVLFLRRRKA